MEKCFPKVTWLVRGRSQFRILLCHGPDFIVFLSCLPLREGKIREKDFARLGQKGRGKKEKLIFAETVYGDLMIQEFTKITGLNLGESSMSGLKSQQHEKPSKHFE